MNAGVNWISTYVDITMDDLKAALIAATPGVAISIKSKSNGFANYNGTRWIGGLKNLVPGQGYMYKSTATENKIFIYPTMK
jgi:hypothetical protein